MLRIIGDGEHATVVKEAVGQDWADVDGRFIAIGEPSKRRSVANAEGNMEWATVVHARAAVSASAFLGVGTFVGSGAVIGPRASIERHSIINSGAIVEHHVHIGAFVNVNPGAVIGGGATIGTGTVLGMGCRIRDHITVGSDVTVGMGAVVVSDVPDGVTVMGCPARIVDVKALARGIGELRKDFKDFATKCST